MASSEDVIQKLKSIYDSVESMITCDDYDDDLKMELETACPDYTTVLSTSKRDLLRNDCGIVVAGETSAGKSTLINILVGSKKPLLKSGILSATAAITRIRNRNEYSVKTYTKDEVLITEETCQDIKALRSAIKHLTDMEKMPEDMKNKLHFIDVHLPVPILKGNAIIVDTPGVGANSNLDSMLLEFLPHAVAFIFVVNVRNAGGIAKDRLGNVLCTVVQNRRKMPCFDTRDVLFLTNCWDAVEADTSTYTASDSDTSDEDDEVEVVWQKVKRVISDSWVELQETNIFRVSLKQVLQASQKQQKNDNFYTNDYSRFERKLTETIDTNMNKRVQFYFQFVVCFHKNAITGTLARLQIFERSEEEHMKVMKENHEKICTLEKECQERRKMICNRKKELIGELSNKLLDYLRSERGRNEILNPPGDCEIDKVALRQLNSEVNSRIEQGIQRWCQQDEVTGIIREVDGMIRNNLDVIQTQIKVIEFGLIGLHTVVLGFSLGLMFESFSAGLVVSLLTLPFSILFVVAFFAFATPFLAAHSWWHGAGYIQETAFKNYDGIIASITLEHLMTGFDNSIGKEIERVVDDIFVNTMPKKIESFKQISRKLQKEYNDIKAKRESIMRMKCRIEVIGEQIKEFKEMCPHAE